MDNVKMACWFSCGAASACAAHLALAKNPLARVIYNPVANEDADNLRFLNDCEKWFGVSIEISRSPTFPSCNIEDVFAARKFMSGPHGAPCTREIKKNARQIWEARNPGHSPVLGFTVDEKHRGDRFRATERADAIFPLIEANMSKQDCVYMIQAAGIDLPRIYSLGYPNANCIGCVKATSPTYWNLVRKTHPEVFTSRAKQSRDIGCRLTRVGPTRLYLDELPPDAQGDPLDTVNIECGIFCEEAAKPAGPSTDSVKGV